MRLVKFLAGSGVASRRASEDIIRAGRVTIDGEVVRDPARDVDDSHAVSVDGDAVGAAGQLVVYALNKPAGVVSTASDPQGRPTVVSLLGAQTRLYPVGRLDIDTTGLILLTNDGDLAYRLTHPRFEVPKTYRVVVWNPPVRTAAIRALRIGITLEDGVTAPARVRRAEKEAIEITIHEGRKRQVKRMFEALGYRVRRLERVAFGALTLGDLAPGKWRRLQPEEVRALAGAGAAAQRPAPGSPEPRKRAG
jgi:23S rRNA pseudouridine2605 synthase